MFFYRESDYKGQLKRKIDELIGFEISLKKQMKVGHSGSAMYRINEMTIQNELIDSSHLNLRCNFEKRSKGIILRINEKQKLYSIAIDNESITNIIITNEEHVSPRILSPMWILLKLGVHIFNFLVELIVFIVLLFQIPDFALFPSSLPEYNLLSWI